MLFLINELMEYIGFTDEDAGRLAELGPLVSPHLEGVAIHFYEAFTANPRTLAIFSGPEQIARLRTSFTGWLHALFCGVYDDKYFEKRKRIGQVHVKVGLKPHFMFAAMNLVRQDLSAILEEVKPGSLYLNSVQKMLDIEMTIMSQSYCDKMIEHKMQIPAAIAAGLAHEIRNPLNAIGLQLTLLERRVRRLGEESGAISSSIDSIRSEIRRVQGLTSEILDFTKPIEIHPTWVNGERLLRSLEDVHGATLIASNITINLDFHGPPEIYVDHDRLVQVMVNLLKNSVEAMEHAGHISLTMSNNNSLTEIVFTDTGPGFPEDVRFRAFDLFFTTKATGTGMGLPIVQKIIEAHGGTIKLEPHNTGSYGTILRIVLPRPKRETHESAQETP